MDWLDKLKECKAKSGLTTQEISAKSGIPSPTLEKIFAGQTKNPGVNSVQTLVRALGFTLDDLFPAPSIDKQNSAPSVSDEALGVAKQYDSASVTIKLVVKAVLSVEDTTSAPTYQAEPKPRTKIIPLHNNRFAAGAPESPGDLEWENFETTNMKADFAVHINGDSMEPYLTDGSIAFGVRRFPKIGEVGAFFLDGGFLVKQYVQDSQGNVYLFSGNRDRDDADMVLWHYDDHDLRCYGTILCAHIPLP